MEYLLIAGTAVIFGLLINMVRMEKAKRRDLEGQIVSLGQQRAKHDADLDKKQTEVDALAVRCNKQAGILGKAMIRNSKGQMQKFAEAYPQGA